MEDGAGEAVGVAHAESCQGSVTERHYVAILLLHKFMENTVVLVLCSRCISKRNDVTFVVFFIQPTMTKGFICYQIFWKYALDLSALKTLLILRVP